MQTPSSSVNQNANSASLSVEEAFLDEFAFHTLPQMAFEVDFLLQKEIPVNWRILATGYLIGQGKTPDEAVQLVKKIFNYANQQGNNHWSRQQRAASAVDGINEAISVRGMGDTAQCEQ